MIQAAVLIPCLQIGGTEVATLETVVALDALGYSTTVVVYFAEVDASMLQTFARCGIQVQCLRLSRGGGTAGALRLAWRLVKFLRGGCHDVIWVQYMTPTLVPLIVARLYGHRLIAAVHVAAGHYSSGGLRRLRWLARWWCDRFVCVSQTTARGIFGQAIDNAGFHQRVRVLPNTIDMVAVETAEPHDWRHDLGLPEHTLLIGYVGRLARNKGVDILLSAAVSLRSVRSQVHWVLVGDGEDRPGLVALAADLKLDEVVHFMGAIPRESIYEAIKGFDIAVVPSREEGFGLSALEVMACGVPLVATRVDALQEVVVDGETGLLFDVESPEDLATIIEILMRDVTLRQQLAIAGIAHVRRHYDRVACHHTVSQFLGELL